MFKVVNLNLCFFLYSGNRFIGKSFNKNLNILYKEFLVTMMKNFKKSEIVIYVVALMLVTAGYFNYTATDKNNLLETYSEDIQQLENTANTGVGDAVLVSNNEVEDKNSNEQNNDKQEQANNSKENENVALVENDFKEDKSELEVNKNNLEESKKQELVNKDENTENEKNTVNANSEVTEADYYANTKLDREKMYASMISTYQNILNNNSISETQKSIASKEITKINNIKNSLMICENLIITKGFDNVVILINENSVNVVVKINGGLNSEKVAQIQNIVSREIGTEVENIHIMEK